MTSPIAEGSSAERPPNSRTSSSDKHSCTDSQGSSNSALHQPKVSLDIQSILHLPEDAIWNLRKQDLRACLLVLQKYALNPYPINPPTLLTPSNVPELVTPPNPSPFLRLPLEIRQLVYKLLLPPPCDPPIRGPRPRQLQTHILLSQPIPASLLLLNHQIHSEALPLLYGAPTQIVHATVDYNIWAHKTQRSILVLSSSLTCAIRHVHLSIHLGSEKRTTKPGDVEADARISEVKKGIKKLCKWLSGADIQSLRISWQEPPQTYTWEQKREVLDKMKGLRPLRVNAVEINWGLKWNKGKKYRFEVEYLKELERGRQEECKSQ